MSWQLTAFILLTLGLVGGFAWYERSRPPSQIVALVAALAALAVAGRVALAALPNAVATTDIVLIAGYALGPAPGFVVGALSGLISNFWLGQGPWTPWQMAGWGLIGIFGAGLATLTARHIGRIPLALACGAAGLTFGALMNFSVMANFGGELSWARFLALQARAIPFDLTHAIGNLTLALIAGPAMIRMLTRFRSRFEWHHQPGGQVEGRADSTASTGRATAIRGGIATLLLTLTLGLAVGEERAQAAGNVEQAVGWLGSVQNADGGFGPSPGDESSVVTTSWAILGLAAAGVVTGYMASLFGTRLGLLVFGLGSVLSVVASAPVIDRWLRPLVVSMLALGAVSMLLFLAFARTPGVAHLTFFLWGVSFGPLGAMYQTAIARQVDRGRDVATSLQSSVFNFSIMLAAWVGGVLLVRMAEGGVRSIVWLALGCFVLAVVVAWRAKQTFRPRCKPHGPVSGATRQPRGSKAPWTLWACRTRAATGPFPRSSPNMSAKRKF